MQQIVEFENTWNPKVAEVLYKQRIRGPFAMIRNGSDYVVATRNGECYFVEPETGAVSDVPDPESAIRHYFDGNLKFFEDRSLSESIRSDLDLITSILR